MPHWQIYHPPTAYQDAESKDALAKAITAFYTGVGMPAFYVVVHFLEVPLSSTYVGAETRTPSDKPFIRLVATHIAHNYPNDDAVIRAAGDTFNKLLAAQIEPKGSDWEFHIAETDRRLWTVNGLTPPERRTDGEALWVKENKPVPY
jgi:phenylpyruvate tautomerase PptA (4-oxalocrotonate tautomerase family)